MDTVENTGVPVGGEGATSSQDTTPQVSTQPVETPNAVSAPEGMEAVTQTEALLAGKYKSPQELEKAYKELEGKIGSLGQKASVADLIQEKYGISPDQLQNVIAQQEQEKMQAEYEANPGAFAYQEVQSLKQQLALQAEEKQLDGFISQNPEYSPFRDKILNLGLRLETNKSYEDIASEYFGQAIAKGQQDAYKRIETKVNTQATSVSSVPQRQLGVEDYKNMSVAEMEALLPHA